MILGEDEGFLALDKPAGIPVFPPHADPAGPCVLHALFEARPEQAEPAWPEGYSGGILHRLDTWTSGLLLVARTLPALEAGRAAFVGQQLSKTYRFLCDRVVGWTEHRVDRPLAHDKSDRRKMCWQSLSSRAAVSLGALLCGRRGCRPGSCTKSDCTPRLSACRSSGIASTGGARTPKGRDASICTTAALTVGWNPFQASQCQSLGLWDQLRLGTPPHPKVDGDPAVLKAQSGASSSAKG